MKKEYIKPDFEIETVSLYEVITASMPVPEGETELPILPFN